MPLGAAASEAFEFRHLRISPPGSLPIEERAQLRNLSYAHPHTPELLNVLLGGQDGQMSFLSLKLPNIRYWNLGSDAWWFG